MQYKNDTGHNITFDFAQNKNVLFCLYTQLRDSHRNVIPTIADPIIISAIL